MNIPTRVRFAPSPTGLLHVGGVRSALFNYLWARHNGGQFILRLEDTDRARLVEGAAEQINASLVGLGIEPDESEAKGGKYGPYRQSDRLDLYKIHAETLIESGALYPCWCSAERLDGLRQDAQKAGTAFKYDRHCLDTTNQRPLSEPHVLRFMIPGDVETVAWDDAVRGHMSIRARDLDDFVAVKSDGYPTYHFANVVDDYLMEITHVLRADEWLPSTPKHLLLFAAFGWDAPTYAHLPAVQGPDGNKKLSKRDGAQSVGEYLAEGYLPEALMSFMASLGWNDGTTQEVYSPQELIEKFTLERIQKSPARFDKDRLIWMNGYMIRALTPEALLERSDSFWSDSATSFSDNYRLEALKLVQERLKFMAELPDLTDFFFEDPSFDPKLVKGFDTNECTRHLVGLLAELTACEQWNHDELETMLRGYVSKHDLKTGQLFGLIRIAITGKTAAPGLFETMVVLGRDRTMQRLLNASKA